MIKNQEMLNSSAPFNMSSFGPLPNYYPFLQLKEMKPVDPNIETLNSEEKQKREVEIRNQWGLPSNHVFAVRTKFGKRLTITVLLNDRYITALVDTGSAVTIVDEKMLLTSEKLNLAPCVERLQSVTGHYLAIEGTVQTSIKIGGKTIITNVLI